MNAEYPARYTDQNGEEETILRNDGKTLRMRVRGIEFSGTQAEYLQVDSKADIFRIWDTLSEYVQETYLCPEFQRRKPGIGYRG